MRASRHRSLIGAWLAVALCVLACSSHSQADDTSAQAVRARIAQAAAKANASVEVVALVELPREPRTRTLSGTWFDLGTRTLFALRDRPLEDPSGEQAPRACIVPLIASEDFRSFAVGSELELTRRPSNLWDGEALARNGDEFYVVADETSALVERFDSRGQYLGQVAMPALFRQRAEDNKGLESLSISPSGHVLFAVNELALRRDDGPATAQRGTLVRVLRKDLVSGQQTQYAYRTEPLDPGRSGNLGISDVLALSDHELLVIERFFEKKHGNSVRVFRIDVRSGADVSQRDALGPKTKTLEKTLLVDVGALPSRGITHHGKQPNPILENYEGLALGPVRPDQRTLLFLTSDDNEQDIQRARVLVLALPLAAARSK